MPRQSGHEISQAVFGHTSFGSLQLTRELTGGLALPHHFLSIGVESIVHDPFGSVEFVVILVAKVSETLGDRYKSGSFRLSIQCIVRVRTGHNPTEQNKRRIRGQLVFLKDRFKRAFLAVVTELNILYVIRYC